MLNCFGPVRPGENIIGSSGLGVIKFTIFRSGPVQKITGQYGVGVPETLPRRTLHQSVIMWENFKNKKLQFIHLITVRLSAMKSCIKQPLRIRQYVMMNCMQCYTLINHKWVELRGLCFSMHMKHVTPNTSQGIATFDEEESKDRGKIETHHIKTGQLSVECISRYYSICMGKNKGNKEKLRLIFDHKIAMLH